DQLGPTALRVGPGASARLVRVLADAQAEVEAVGVVLEVEQQVPQGEGVLAARHRHQHAVPRLDHAEVVDGPLHLLPAVAQEAVLAEGGVVTAQLYDGRPTTAPALHAAPPDVTFRTSTTSQSSSSTSWVTRVSPLITSTDSPL